MMTGSFDDDDRLWQHYLKGVKPLKTKPRQTSHITPTDGLPKKVPCPHKKPKIDKRQPQSDNISQKPKPVINEKPCPSSLDQNLDRQLAKKLKRGSLGYQASIDLHGDTLDQAFHRLYRFIDLQYHQQNRNILVITGKGNRGEGKIRQSFQSWLNHPTLKPMVLAFTQAQIRDGGDGAFYVLLKKKR